MRRKTRAAFIVACLSSAVGGCVSPAEAPNTRAAPTTDEFSSTIDVVGPRMVDNPLFGINDNFRLVTHIDKRTHAVSHVIEVEIDHQGDFFNFRFAADDTSAALPLVPVKRQRNVFGQNRTELVNIIVPDAALRAHAATGYRVRMSARDGTYYDIAITSAMIAAQFDAVQRIRSAPAGSPEAAAAVANATTPSGKPLLGIAPFDLPFGAGVQVNRVDPNTPAEAAGFQVGDLLKKYNGVAVTGADQFRGLIEKTQPGVVVPIEITRHGQAMTLSAQM